MQPSSDAGPTGTWTAGPDVAAEVLRQHRALVSIYTPPPAPPTEPEDGTEDGGTAVAAAAAPSRMALSRTDLPAPLVDLIERYEARTPGVHLVPLRLLSIGRPEEAATLGDADLPAEADLVSLTVTQTVVSRDQVEVAGVVLLAARSTDAPG